MAAILSVVTVDLVGMKSFDYGFGIISLAQGLSTFIGAPTVGKF